MHVADVNYLYTNPVKGEKSAAKEEFSKDKLKPKAEVGAYVKNSFADGAAAIKAKGDAGLNSLVVDPYANQQVRVIVMVYGSAAPEVDPLWLHDALSSFNGLVPPESRPKK